MNKARLIELLNKTHVVGVPNWTTAETIEAYNLLADLGEMWFRSVKKEIKDAI